MSVRSIARRALERMLLRFDYRLSDMKSDPCGLEGACDMLAQLGFKPRTVIDVGVGTGTPWLYKAFASARFELFEAIESFRPAIDEATRGLDCGVHFCALGEAPSRLIIEFNRATPTSSTMAHYEPSYLQPALGVVEQEVTVRRLDEFGPFAGPVLLKLDVEGYEAHVLRGAGRALDNVEVVITEASVIRRTRAEPSLAEYLGLLESLGFSLINIAEINPVSRGGPIAYMDLVFVRNDSPLRQGHALSNGKGAG